MTTGLRGGEKTREATLAIFDQFREKKASGQTIMDGLGICVFLWVMELQFNNWSLLINKNYEYRKLKIIMGSEQKNR